MMVDRINDIMWQARQGSVAAIIQVLNQELADAGVRTRAMFADGVLQLLCEARDLKSLEQSTLVPQIRHVFQSISPRNIYRIRINSRIVREQQLLWLEEINRDPESQLLWSEEIALDKPSAIQSIVEDLKQRKETTKQTSLPATSPSRQIIITPKRPRNSFFVSWSMILLSACGCVALSGLAIYFLLGDKIQIAIQTNNQSPIGNDSFSNVADNSPSGGILENKTLENQNNSNQGNFNPIPTNNFSTNNFSTSNSTNSATDNFSDAVRIANQLSQKGKTATNKTHWLEIAANWQRASDLMAKVDPTNPRYQEAKIRTQLYREYSLEARKKADSFNLGSRE